MPRRGRALKLPQGPVEGSEPEGHPRGQGSRGWVETEAAVRLDSAPLWCYKTLTVEISGSRPAVQDDSHFGDLYGEFSAASFHRSYGRRSARGVVGSRARAGDHSDAV